MPVVSGDALTERRLADTELTRERRPRLKFHMEYCQEHPDEMTKVASVQKQVGFRIPRHSGWCGFLQWFLLQQRLMGTGATNVLS